MFEVSAQDAVATPFDHQNFMNPQVRRQIAVLVVGMIGAIVALIAATWLRQDACLDAGGRWLVETETCELAAGAGSGSTVRAYLLGAVIGLLAAAMLWRMFSFFASRPRA